MRWGLVPFWAKDVKIGSRMINARAETVAEKPAFRRAFAQRRCLLPADGYYEWQQLPGEPKQPIYISRSDGQSLAFAGLYELWRDPEFQSGDDDAWLWTTTIITTSAPDELGMIHDRMPMIIDSGSWADWLDPANTDVADLRALLHAGHGQRPDHLPGLDRGQLGPQQRSRADRAARPRGCCVSRAGARRSPRRGRRRRRRHRSTVLGPA